MSGQVGALLRAGLGLKLTQLRLAATSYVEDRADHGKGIAKAYIVGGAFYAAAGIFFIAACLVGVHTLFYYVSVQYGIYTAFAAAAGACVFLAIVSAAIAAAKMTPPKANYASLGDRLRTALTGKRVKSSVLSRDQVAKSAAATKPVSQRAADSRPATPKPVRNPVDTARATAADVLRSSSYAPPVSRGTPAVTKAGAALAVTLVGWALARRFSVTGKTGV